MSANLSMSPARLVQQIIRLVMFTILITFPIAFTVNQQTTTFAAEKTAPAQEIILEEPTQLHPPFGTGCEDSGWERYEYAPGYFTYLTLNTNDPAQSTNWGEWRTTLPTTGQWQISALITDHPVTLWPCLGNQIIPGDTIEARYEIYHVNGSSVAVRNQLPEVNTWLDLGVYTFSSTQEARVRLVDLNSQPNLTETMSYSQMKFVYIPPTPNSATVNGTVRNSSNNQPLANVLVSIGGKSTTTNGSGQYSLANVPMGIHTLRGQLNGYHNHEQAFNVNTSVITSDINLDPIITNGFKLPYPGGSTYMVTGTTTYPHINSGQPDALDFGISEGDTIVATRSGRVAYVVKNFQSGGCNAVHANSANYVMIDHGDGTYSFYVHLQYGSIPVSYNQQVQRGQLIGRVGLTGYVCGPHLHYFVRQGANGTIPANFIEVGGVPNLGVYYTSGNYLGSLHDIFKTVSNQSTPQGDVQFWLTGSSNSVLQLPAYDAQSTVTEMRVANSAATIETALWQAYNPTHTWPNNQVAVQFKTADNRISGIYEDTIDTIASEPIQADFAIEQAEVCVGEFAKISNLTTPYCEQCGWEWDFGNGQTSRYADPSTGRGLNVWEMNDLFYGVVYSEPGTYNITLEASGANNTSSVTKPITVIDTVNSEFTLTRNGNTVTVEAVATGSDLIWEWQFEEGVTATGRTASHTYDDFDVPQVIYLKVTSNNSGCEGESYKIIENHQSFLPVIIRQ